LTILISFLQWRVHDLDQEGYDSLCQEI
jgi:hypothetical protein